MKYEIGDTLEDEHGNIGQVVIHWDDGDFCHFENDAAHCDPVIIGNINEEK